MKHLKYIFLILIFVQSGLIAQEQPKPETVSAYLDANGTMGQYDFAYSSLEEMLRGRFPETDKNAAGWKFFKENKAKSIEEMKSLIIPVYQQNFSVEEMNQMLKFYLGDTGKQLVKDRSKLTEQQKQELNTFYNTEVGAKIIAKKDILGKEISKASEGWSRDLYETAMSLLK